MNQVHQLNLFDLDPYVSKSELPDIKICQIKKVPGKVEAKQLDLDLYPELPKRSCFDPLKPAA